MIKVFHLHGRNRDADLQTGMFCLLQGGPDIFDVLLIQSHRHSHGTVFHRRRHRLHPQSIGAGLFHAFQFDNGNPKGIQQFCQFDFLPEGQSKGLSLLLHGHVADLNSSHHNHLSVIKKVPEAVWPQGRKYISRYHPAYPLLGDPSSDFQQSPGP